MLTFKEAFNADFLRYKGPNYNPIKVIVSPALKSIYVALCVRIVVSER